MYSALTYEVMKIYLTRVWDKKLVMAILHWKQALLFDKSKLLAIAGMVVFQLLSP